MKLMRSQTTSCICNNSLSTCSSLLIRFCIQQLLLAKINHVIYFSQSQLLLAKTNEERTTSRKALQNKCTLIFVWSQKRCAVLRSSAMSGERDLAQKVVYIALWNISCIILLIDHIHQNQGHFNSFIRISSLELGALYYCIHRL